MWASLNPDVNRLDWQDWAAKRNATGEPKANMIELRDMLHTLPAIMLCLSPTKERSDTSDVPINSNPNAG
jgi:hypothetical protein